MLIIDRVMKIKKFSQEKIKEVHDYFNLVMEHVDNEMENEIIEVLANDGFAAINNKIWSILTNIELSLQRNSLTKNYTVTTSLKE
jgi:hypothetical protein